jgi:hypothetical protein
MWFANLFDSQNAPTSGGQEYRDLRAEDPPPADYPNEQYSSWRATAIYSLSPFSSPPGR